MKVLVQDWIESERSWGIRPDGHSIHFTVDQVQQCIDDHWTKEAKRNPDGVAPACYSRPESKPYWAEITESEVDKHTKRQILKGETFWITENYPKYLKRITDA